MALLVSLRRELHQLELGAHGAVLLEYDQLCLAEGETPLARHRHNRWIAETDEEFATLEVLGPLVVTTPDGKTLSLGPYQRLSMFDGVLTSTGARSLSPTFSSGTGTCTTPGRIGRRCASPSTAPAPNRCQAPIRNRGRHPP
jgi:hypothetical protein